MPCLIDILDAIIHGQKNGGPHGDCDFLYITTGFYLQPFDLSAVYLDDHDADLPEIVGAIGRYRSVPVFSVNELPKNPLGHGECHNVQYTYVCMDFID